MLALSVQMVTTTHNEHSCGGGERVANFVLDPKSDDTKTIRFNCIAGLELNLSYIQYFRNAFCATRTLVGNANTQR